MRVTIALRGLHCLIWFLKPGWIMWCTLLIAALAGCSTEPVRKPHRTWVDYGGGPDQSKYMELDQINKSNLNQLKVAWFYPTGDDNVYQFNPLVVDNVMYVLARENSLVAIDAVTGKEIWIHANLQGIAARGINYWESKDRKDRRLIFQMNNYLQTIDALTGKSILSFGKNGLVDLREGLGRDPKSLARVQSATPGKVFENLILLGSSTGEHYVSSPGHLRAYDVVSGKLVWTFHTIPQPGEYGYDTWPKDAYMYIGGVNAWGEISIDERRGIAFYPLGSPTYDYYGGDRIGSNLYGNSLLALDARTGKRIWHYQVVHHDLFDFDLASAPQLVTVNHEGKKIDAVVVACKNGFMYAFDRVNGKPLWPIKETPVPPSDVPGEQAWPTQPFPTVLAPYARQIMTSKDVNPYLLTPEERETWKKRIDSMQTGLYTPVSVKRATVALPGSVGGASWGSTAANPDNGTVYVHSIDWPSFYGKVEKHDPPTDKELKLKSGFAEGGESIYMNICQGCHGADRTGGLGPQLTNMGSRFNFTKFQQVVASGKGEMPAFPHLSENHLKNIYHFLVADSANVQTEITAVGKPADDKQAKPSGPVVASGGAPGGQQLREMNALDGGATKRGFNEYGIPYPKGAIVPATRYYIPPGWGLKFPYVISPPWSTITAYDLNTGKIKFRIPIGQDLKASEEGAKNTGVLRSQHNGMIVTSTGILFCTAKDGKIYAFDAETGKELWSAKLPTGTEGLPSMYEVNRRQYLVVSASTPLRWGRGGVSIRPGAPVPQGGYIAFSLP